MQLSPVMQKYILHWGEMGSRWGVNRTIAQIHALLYLAEEPLTAETIAETLGVARSNVSTSLKELQSWGLVKVTHLLGDRRDYFESLHEVWDIFTVIMEERKRREIDPTISLLRECLIESENDSTTPPGVKKRIASTLDFMELLTGWYEQMKKLPSSSLLKLMRLGGKVQAFLSGKA
ncbi:MAG: MarR family transcriptional regulator [Gammaproteobacteria bacterium]|nr:MarR family transcriptional regulator [Gammaproteobacteria bacterium]MDH5651968.1 MarR family transcriptional regulator [Gammaproteobacteria bacterium]